jgi:hypothetical protein
MALAARHGDLVTPTYGRVAQAEWAWARAWTAALMHHVLSDPTHGEANARQVDAWLADWIPPGLEALDALGGIADASCPAVRREFVELLDDCGLLSGSVKELIA